MLLTAALAQDEFFTFRHGCIMDHRIKKVRNQSRKLEAAIEEARKMERRIADELEVNYDDAAVATTTKDKVALQATIQKLQSQLIKTRNAKRSLLRRLRHVTDGITGIERGRIIRRNRLEEFVDSTPVELSAEFKAMDEKLFELEKTEAVKYAQEAAKRAAAFEYKQLARKNATKAVEQKTMKKEVEAAAKKAYTEMYDKIIANIRRITLESTETKDIVDKAKETDRIIDNEDATRYAKLNGKLDIELGIENGMKLLDPKANTKVAKPAKDAKTSKTTKTTKTTKDAKAPAKKDVKKTK